MEATVGAFAVPSVLVVEDDTISRNVMCGMISRAFPHVEVLSAENGRDGLEMFRKHQSEVVVTNLRMPEMDGISMIKEIDSAKADVRFIVMTGYSSEMNNFEGIDVEYQIKPIIFDEVMSSIKNCLDVFDVPSFAKHHNSV